MREQFGVNYLQLNRKVVRRFFGIDNIFLYQFGVYFIIWIWALTVLMDGRTTDYHTELAMSIAPIVVAAGYMMVGKIGAAFCAGGDLVMAFCTGQRAFWEYNEYNRFSFSTALVMAISLCMFVRMIRDLIIICTKDPDKPRIILDVTGDE